MRFNADPATPLIRWLCDFPIEADWGLKRMRESMESGDFRFGDYFEAVDASNHPS